MKITNKHVFFWGGIFSNWYKCEFDAEIDGKVYHFHNTEQYFMFMKAITFKDMNSANQILKKGKNPKIAKMIGRLVKNFDDDVWHEKKYSIMLDANYLKFSSSKEMKEELLKDEYKGKGFVEASPFDKIWGIGISENYASDDESSWEGENLLGKVLDDVRNLIISEKHETT